MKRACIGVLAVLLMGFAAPSRPAHAESLSLSPLEYKASLQKGETKKGHIDLVNPEPRVVKVQLAVQGFRQADTSDIGGLDFYTNEKLTQGIILDLNEVELGPNEGARIYFLLDSDKLPSGDVFAAIMARGMIVHSSTGATPAVEAGTLLMLTNGKTPEHHGYVETIEAPWWQTGEKLTAEMTVRNSDDPNGEALGFTPRILVETWPYGSKRVDGPLLFAGRGRTISYQQPGNYFGPIKLTVTVDGHSKTAWLFAVTGYWRLLVPILAVLLVASIAGIRYRVQHRHNRG